MFTFDAGAENTVSNQKLFADFMIEGVKSRPDSVPCDVAATSGARAMVHET